MANNADTGFKFLHTIKALTTAGKTLEIGGRCVYGIYATAASATPTIKLQVTFDGTNYMDLQSITLSTTPTYYPITNLDWTKPFTEVRVVPSATLHASHFTIVVTGVDA
jgi:hypothetical protein